LRGEIKKRQMKSNLREVACRDRRLGGFQEAIQVGGPHRPLL
jgi:hypothetical protein